MDSIQDDTYRGHQTLREAPWSLLGAARAFRYPLGSGRRCWACIDAVQREMLGLEVPPALRKKLPALHASLRKVETLFYEMALISAGKSRVSDAPMEEEPPA